MYTAIEQLDYSVTVPSVNGLETVRYFAEHPIYGTVGYPTWDDARHDMHGVLGVDQYLDSIGSMINAGFVGDHYTFNGQNILVEVRSDWELWTWTPETGFVYDDIPNSEPEAENRLSHKKRRAARRIQNKRHKSADRKHGKGVFSYEYKENGIIKTQTLPNNMRSKSAWSKACHEWGDPDGLKGRVPRTQSVNIHRNTKPVPEQEPWYVGVYGTLEVCEGATVTMEWPVPEAVQGEPV